MTNAETSKSSNEGAGLFEIMTWLEVNKKRLVVVAVAAVVIGFGMYVYGYFAEQKEQKAMAALMSFRQPIGSTNAITTTPAQFLKVASDYSGTAAAEQASILAAGAYFAENKYSDAQAQFQKYLSEFGNNGKWAASAEFGVAASLEAQNKTDEALTAYQNVASKHANDPVVSQAKLAMARIYEAKKQPEQAYKIYEELSKPVSPTSATSEAFMRRGQLVKQYPHLAITNAPAATMSTAPATTAPATTAPAPKATATTTNKVIPAVKK